MALVFDEIFKILTRCQKLNGTYPFAKRGKIWYISTALIQTFLLTVFLLIIYNIIHHNLKIKDYSQIIKHGAVAMIYVFITFEYWVLMYYQESLLILINNMKTDYELSKQLSVDEQKILENYALQGRYVCKQWLYMAMGCPSSFLVKSVFLMSYYYYKNDFRFVNYYELIYPSFIEDNKDNLFVFLFTYGVMGLYGYYAGVMYIAYTPLGPIMMLHACGQLELVKNRIDDLFAEADDEVINRKLKGIIKQLQYIDGFVDIIQSVFMIAYELTMKGSAILLPFAVYEVLEAKDRGELSMEFITFIIGGTLTTSSPCYYSDLLMEKGEDVRMALYSCGWELHYNRRARSTLQIMLAHGLRPIAIRTVFRTLCLDALTELFQQSYALFNLINAMWG